MQLRYLLCHKIETCGWTCFVSTSINERQMTVWIPTVQNRLLTLFSVYFFIFLTSEYDEKFLSTTCSIMPSKLSPFRTKLVFLVISMLELVDIIIFKMSSLDNIESETATQIVKFSLDIVTNMNWSILIFQLLSLQQKKNTTSKHPRSKHWLFLYDILNRDKGGVHITHSMSATNYCWTEYKLPIPRLQIKIRRRPRQNK